MTPTSGNPSGTRTARPRADPTTTERRRPEDCWPWWPPGPWPEPTAARAAGGGGGPIRPPSGRPQTAADAAAAALAAREHATATGRHQRRCPGWASRRRILPLAPITLPVIVAPPGALPGGGAPRGLHRRSRCPVATQRLRPNPPRGASAARRRWAATPAFRPRRIGSATPNICGAPEFRRSWPWQCLGLRAFWYSPVPVDWSGIARPRRAMRYAPAELQDL